MFLPLKFNMQIIVSKCLQLITAVSKKSYVFKNEIERFSEEFLRKGFLRFSVSKIPGRNVCYEKKKELQVLKNIEFQTNGQYKYILK